MTDSLVLVPSAPQNVRVVGRTTTQLKFYWDPPNSPNGVVKGYHIYQRGNFFNSFTIMVDSFSSNRLSDNRCHNQPY